MKKFIMILLCLCLCVGFAIQVLAAGKTTLKLNLPSKLPAVGQSFTVTVDVSENPGVNAVQMKLLYDADVVKCSGVTVGKALDGMLSATNPRSTRNGMGAKISAAGVESADGDGVIGTFTFTVLKDGDPGFSLSEILLTDSDGNDISYSVETSGMEGNTEEETKKPEKDSEGNSKEETGSDKGVFAKEFSDIPTYHWAHSEIMRAAQSGLVEGFADGTFGPDQKVTRAQFVTMLWRMAGQPKCTAKTSFRDVPNGAWFAEQVAWAAENGYVTGVSNTMFDPNGNITREQAMAILFRYSGSVSGMEMMFASTYDSFFMDSSSISEWAKSGVYWCLYKGIVTGTSDMTINPNGLATRAQIAVIFLRYMDKAN